MIAIHRKKLVQDAAMQALMVAALIENDKARERDHELSVAEASAVINIAFEIGEAFAVKAEELEAADEAADKAGRDS